MSLNFRLHKMLHKTGFRLALVQAKTVQDKRANIAAAADAVRIARKRGARVAALPECFSCPYDHNHFTQYAERIPEGHTSQRLSRIARDSEVYLVAGTIPELGPDDKLYNSCTVWSPQGELIATHRKLHLYDIDIPGQMPVKESSILSAGRTLTTFDVDGICKIGLGICFDVRFAEMAQLYRDLGCQMLIYPGTFNMTTGPLHWRLLHRARSVDNQLYVAAVSPARDIHAQYIAYGYSMVVDPWGRVVKCAGVDDEIIHADIDLKTVEDFRNKVPVYKQRRTDVYETILKQVTK